MDYCEQCGYDGSDWCMSCTIISFEEFLRKYNISFIGVMAAPQVGSVSDAAALEQAT